MSLRRPALLLCALAIALFGAGCSQQDSPQEQEQEPSPEEVLAQAQGVLDDTEGVHLRLSTPELPDSVSGITAADGLVTQDPAFDGTITVVVLGTAVEVPVVAVDDVVYAQLPLTSGWSEIDPADYGAPDPSGLIAGETGFSSLLTATDGVQEGESVRGGQDNSEVLTTYTGTVDGPDMRAVIPSSSGDSFEAEYQVTEDGRLRRASFTGVFYPDSPEMTYDVDLDDYDTSTQISAPEATESTDG